MAEELRLHIGGVEPKPGWKIVNVLAAPQVDYIASIGDLGAFADNSVADIYTSHVLEHVPFKQVHAVLRGMWRVLEPAGRLMASVPDMPTLCRLYNDPRADAAMRMRITHAIFGAHYDEHDVHHIGYNEELLGSVLRDAGFRRIRRVADFGLFDDASLLRYLDEPISLNMQAQKSSA